MYPTNKWICLPIISFQSFWRRFFSYQNFNILAKVLLVFVYVSCEFTVIWHIFDACFWHRTCVCCIFLSVSLQCCRYKYHHVFYILVHKQCLLFSSFLHLIFQFCKFSESRHYWVVDILHEERGVVIVGFFCLFALLISVLTM